MEDHDWVPSDGKQPCGVGARAPGFGPNGHLRGGGACSRSREGDVSPGDFRSKACLARSRALPRERRRAGAGGEARGQQDAPGPGPARVRVCTVGRCKACARHGPDARQCQRWRCGIEGQRRWVKIQHKPRAEAPGTERARRAEFAPRGSAC